MIIIIIEAGLDATGAWAWYWCVDRQKIVLARSFPLLACCHFAWCDRESAAEGYNDGCQEWEANIDNDVDFEQKCMTEREIHLFRDMQKRYPRISQFIDTLIERLEQRLKVNCRKVCVFLCCLFVVLYMYQCTIFVYASMLFQNVSRFSHKTR